MIGIENQYILSFNIGDYKDTISSQDLISFKLVEETGNVLPTFELIFYTVDLTLLELLSEGNTVSLSLGRTVNSLKDTLLTILNVTKTSPSDGSFVVKMTGFYNAMSYLSNKKVSSKKGTSSDVIKQIASQSFDVDITTTTSDSMFWLQQNISDRDYITHLWLHSWVENSCPMIGITAMGEFIFRDIRSIVSRDTPNWRFVSTPQQDIDVAFNGTHIDVAPSGFMNRFGASGKQMVVRDSTKGTFNNLKTMPLSPMLSMASNVNNQKSVEPKISQMVEISENVHPHFWDAYNQNIATLAALSSNQICLTVVNDFRPFRVLDLAFYKEDYITTSQATKEATEYASGYYVITKIANVIKNNSLATYVFMTREAMNTIRGDQF